MKRTLIVPLFLIGAFVVAAPSPAAAQMTDGLMIAMPESVKWGPAPAALPPGAELAVLYGDPGKEGPFAMRVKFPQGYSVAPHTHPKPEAVTVVSGVFKLGMGKEADATKAQALPAGSFAVLEPGTVHYASSDEETVIQINSVGKWALDYVNPADDPRKSQ